MKAIDELKKAIDEEEIFDELEKMLIRGLKLKLETARRKNPYFKGSRRGTEHMKMEGKRAAMRFARVFVKGYFIVQRSYSWLVSPN